MRFRISAANLRRFLAKGSEQLAENRARAVCAIIPEMAKVSEIVEKPLVDTTPIECKLMRKLIAKKWTHDGRITLELNNYTGQDVDASIYDILRTMRWMQIQNRHLRARWTGSLQKSGKRQFRNRPSGACRIPAKVAALLDISGVEDTKKMVVDFDV